MINQPGSSLNEFSKTVTDFKHLTYRPGMQEANIPWRRIRLVEDSTNGAKVSLEDDRSYTPIPLHARNIVIGVLNGWVTSGVGGAKVFFLYPALVEGKIGLIPFQTSIEGVKQLWEVSSREIGLTLQDQQALLHEIQEEGDYQAELIKKPLITAVRNMVDEEKREADDRRWEAATETLTHQRDELSQRVTQSLDAFETELRKIRSKPIEPAKPAGAEFEPVENPSTTERRTPPELWPTRQQWLGLIAGAAVSDIQNLLI